MALLVQHVASQIGDYMSKEVERDTMECADAAYTAFESLAKHLRKTDHRRQVDRQGGGSDSEQRWTDLFINGLRPEELRRAVSMKKPTSVIAALEAAEENLRRVMVAREILQEYPGLAPPCAECEVRKRRPPQQAPPPRPILRPPTPPIYKSSQAPFSDSPPKAVPPAAAPSPAP